MPTKASKFRPSATAKALILAACIGGNAVAQEEGERLVEQARCYACHDTSGTSLGPPYIAIAARHASRREIMIDVLARKIVNGGGGNWGLVPMVPNQWVTIEEAKRMSEWILSLAPD